MALTSFFSALTGLNSNSHSINVIGDNLANLNTVAFKAGKATFAEIIGGMSGFSATGNPMIFGQGSMLNGLVHKQVQGTPEYTGNSTDVMINGNGYFVVETGDGGIGYTRSGRFQFNSEGGLVTSDGYKLMGYKADEEGLIDLSTGITPLEIRMGQFVPAVKTTQMSAAVNLDSQIDPANAALNTFATSIQVFDSLGSQHTVKLTFEKQSLPGEEPVWDMTADLMYGNPPAPISIDIDGGSSVTLYFDDKGRLNFYGDSTTTGATITPQELTLTLPGSGGGVTGVIGDNVITLNLQDSKGNSMFTSAASKSATSSTYQNGYASSTLESVGFDNEGRVVGLAANGNSIILAQLALATFPNVEGMQKYNGSTFIASRNAGEPSIGTAGSGGRGSVKGASLEMSNVDMAEEFVNLIIAQRAFQANARMITTSDELYMEAISLKR